MSAILFLITALIWVVWLGYFAVMFARNEMVYQFRLKALDESKWENGSHTPYDKLPSYDEMMRRVWVWNFKKFLPKDQPSQTPEDKP